MSKVFRYRPIVVRFPRLHDVCAKVSEGRVSHGGVPGGSISFFGPHPKTGGMKRIAATPIIIITIIVGVVIIIHFGSTETPRNYYYTHDARTWP